MTLIPWVPSSIANTLLMVSTAAFDAAYAAPPGRGLRTEPVEMFTIAPGVPALTQCLAKACIIMNEPVTLTAKTLSQSGWVISSSMPSG